MKGYYESLNNEEKEIFHFSSLYDCLVLYSLEYESLVDQAGPLFDPIGELDSCYFLVFKVEENFSRTTRLKKVESSIPKLKKFASKVDTLEDDEWTYDQLKSNPNWSELRKMANEILTDLGEMADRKFGKLNSRLPTLEELRLRETK